MTRTYLNPRKVQEKESGSWFTVIAINAKYPTFVMYEWVNQPAAIGVQVTLLLFNQEHTF